MRHDALAMVVMSIAGCIADPPAYDNPFRESDQLLSTNVGYRFHWEHFPVTVSILGDAACHYNRQLAEAVDFWNATVGERVLVIVDGEAQIEVSEGTFAEGDADTAHVLGLSSIVVSGLGQIVYAKIYLYNAIPSFFQLHVMKHELGHCLGLAHDPYQMNSLMYPYTWDSDRQRVTRDDAAAVRHQVWSAGD